MANNGTETAAILEASRFWVQKVSVPIFVLLGLAGNILTVMILTRKRMRSTTNIYLTALAIADIIYLIFGLLLSFQHYGIHSIKYEMYWKFYGIMSWLFDAASSTSAWLAACFTVERYIAVCHPMKGRTFCTERKAKSLITIVYIVCTLTTASTNLEYAINITNNCVRNCSLGQLPPNPKHENKSRDIPYHTINVFFDKKERHTDPQSDFLNKLHSILDNCTSHPHIIYVPIYPNSALTANSNTLVAPVDVNLGITPEKPLQTADHVLEKSVRTVQESFKENLTTATEDDNATCCQKEYRSDIQLTELGKNHTYKSIRNWYGAVVLIIIPFLFIAIFNALLIRAMYLSKQMRRVMTNSQEHTTHNNDKRITIMLIAIVIIFLICNTPNAVHGIYYSFHSAAKGDEENIAIILGNFFNLLVMINAPCNFIIYCLLSKKFRSTFMQIFWDRRKAAKQMETETILLSRMKSSNQFNPHKHGLMKRNTSEYHTPRNLETQSLTSTPRSRSVTGRPMGKARSTDLVV